ncbi:hypothetical protein BJ322DRAFT_254518 [Thelephora terrestris]|uniref:Uncharacterized protein n=1 Tax=Thelephora terrestris TaxID=56493 RepID=A0A9P6H830_9AGAM|nr:hypothetical protein BJ322DRAFT_254518 [Thelephora terrestris]
MRSSELAPKAILFLFNKCQQNINIAQNVTIAADSSPTLHGSYEQCLLGCGSGMGQVNFSQNYDTWLLPWISLMFHIPFSAERPLDDVVSFLITMGSPALAAYSLQITHLNKCWITTAFLDVKYPNSKLVATALAAFHHIPIKIEYKSPFLHSLIALAKNDEYWSLLEPANKTRQWSITLVLSVILAIISYILTIANTIISRGGNTGYGIAAIWTFLLPLVIGWLYIGYEPEPSHLRNCLAKANRNACVATERRDQPAEITSPKAIEFAEEDDVDLSRNDELKPVALFNYSRAFVTATNAEVLSSLVRKAAANAKLRIPVSNCLRAEVQMRVGSREDAILPANRVGTTDEVTGYCTMVLQPPEGNPEYRGTTDTAGTLREHGLITPCRWAPGIWKRVTVASILAIGLQWGTVGGAVLFSYSVPPTGLGCRSFSFLLYGAAGTLSFFLFLTSSVLAHMSRPPSGKIAARSFDTGAVICRRLGQSVAIVSGIGVLLLCFCEFVGLFDSCYCTSTAFDIGSVFVAFPGSAFLLDSSTVGLQVGGLAGAFLTAISFGFSMYLGLPARR